MFLMYFPRRIAQILAVLTVLAVGIPGCFGTRMVFSGISGPDAVAENSDAEYAIEIGGERPDLYQWAVEPSSAGTITNRDGPSCTFHAGAVESNTEIRIRVTIRSPHDGPYLLGKVVEIIDTSRTPVAAAHADKSSVQIGEPVQFFDDSTDPDGPDDIMLREWDFSYDEVEGFQAESVEANPTHIYTDAGTYLVQLRVTDKSALSDVLDEPLVIDVGQSQALRIAWVNRSRTTSLAGSSQEAVELSVEFADPAPEPGSVTYLWSCPYGAFDDPGSATPRWTPPDQVLDCEISVEVTDSHDSTDTSSCRQWVTSLGVLDNPSSPDDMIPSQTLPTAFQGEINPADFVFPTTVPDGNVVYINYWATWCGYCVAELPDLQEVYEKYRSGDFVYLLINVKDSRAIVENFANSHPYDPTYWGLDLTGGYFDATKGWNGDSAGIPQHLVFDRDGRCRWAHLGALIDNTSDLENAIEELL